MLTVEPNNGPVGATIRGVDLSQPLDRATFGEILVELARHGYVRFPDQHIELADLKRFSEMFGEIQGNPIAASDRSRPFPEIGILSNVKENGAYIGSPDAGQDWHTDMSYRDVMGFVNVLYGLKVPRRDGRALGGTEFSNMRLVYEALPDDLKHRLDGMTVTHNFEKFWENMRQNHGSQRPAMTDEQRRRRPAVVHPIFLTHPIGGFKSLYCNPGYAMRINELPEKESDEILDFLFEFQLRPEFRYTHSWTENDLIVWDNLGTIHRAIADYRPDEIRLMRRCQVMATKVFTTNFREIPADARKRAA
jgi:taurine dioxygenase